ncbi:MAG: hypothetical protein BGO32_03840 [Bacteroidetes bacterium 37-13]|nr:MAG: hypothetical protein BGO32_03840 [Bacteroidetes bacterium 37-13]
MKMKNCIISIAVLLISISISAQEEFAFAAPKGIFVYLGKNIPNGKKISSILLSRKDEKGNFKKLAEVKCAATEQEFMSEAKDAAKYFPDFSFAPDSSLKSVWLRASKYGTLDSAGYWAMHPAVRMALGILYYDLDAKENTKYSYKFDNYTSTEVSYPFHPKYDDVSLSEYQYDKNGLYIRFKSVGRNPSKAFKLYKYNDDKKPEEVSGIRNQYKIKDTTFYIINDTKVTAAKQYQYSWIGVDVYGNTSYGSLPFIIDLRDFSTVYFKRIKAKKADAMLAINLNWNISDVTNVKSIHIFKSDNYDKGFKEIGVMEAADTSFTDESIIPDKIYYYYLQIADKTNTLTKNSAKFFDFGFDKSTPITPILKNAVGIANGIKLELAVPDNFIAGYRVFRSENGSDDYTVIADMVKLNPDSNTATYYDTGATMNGRTFYNYKIQSENTSHAVSELSNKLQARPEMSAKVIAPTNLSVYFQDSVINLFWNDIRKDDEMVAGYRLYKREKGAAKFTSIFSEDSVYEGNRFIDAIYSAGKTYEYAVESVDLFGYASDSRASAQVSIDKYLPAAPAISSAINLPDGILIEWSKPNISNLKGYKLYRYQRGQNPVAIAQPNADAENYLDKTAKPGELYFYTLTSLNSEGTESTESEEAGVRH